MSFCFNFIVDESPDVTGGNTSLNSKTGCATTSSEESGSPAEQVKEAKEHFPPSDPQQLLDDAVYETVSVGALPPLHYLNETVFERTVSEREDVENVLYRTAEQRCDLISGVYEGGLKVWECTYDLLEVIDRQGEAFGDKAVLDLGCGAGLLGILALRRGARHVHFQDYNSSVIEQLTVSNVLLNCHDDDTDDSIGEDKATIVKEEDSKLKKTNFGTRPPKRRALDSASQHPLVSRCKFFSGDWRTFLTLASSQETPLKYDIIMTSETIYNTAYYPAFHNTLLKLLAEHGVVYLATKSHYFGVGGGLHLFESFVAERGVFSVDHLWDGEDGLQRHVVVLRFKKGSD